MIDLRPQELQNIMAPQALTTRLKRHPLPHSAIQKLADLLTDQDLRRACRVEAVSAYK
jgi:hypothetical protein